MYGVRWYGARAVRGGLHLQSLDGGRGAAFEPTLACARGGGGAPGKGGGAGACREVDRRRESSLRGETVVLGVR